MKRTIQVIAALLAVGLFAVNASAGPCKPPGPFVNASLQGPVTVTGFSEFSACPGVTCTASSGDCECETYSGSLNGPGFGQVSMVLNLTIDDDDTTISGSNGGICFPEAGLATLTGPGAAVAVMAVTGAECVSPFPGPGVTNGNFSYTQDPALGESGKFSEAFGTGNLSIGFGTDKRFPGGVSLVGTLQLKHGIDCSTSAQ